MPTIYDIAKKFRTEVIKHSDYAEDQLHAAYMDAFYDIEARFTQIVVKITERGGKPTASDLVRMSQYSDLLEALNKHVDEIAVRGGESISRSQQQAVRIAQEAVEQQLFWYQREAGQPFERSFLPAPSKALEEIIGTTRVGSPLWSLLQRSGGMARMKVVDELQKGIVAGLDAKRLAKNIRDAWGEGMVRAMALARTETHRAYRLASIAAYEANSDVVTKYEWLATNSTRTCVACLALDGTVYAIKEPPRNHVNCRCTIIPVIKGDRRPKRTTGSDWFEKQDDATKAKMLGPSGFKAYKAGAKLDDFVHIRDDAQWGKQAIARVPASFVAPKAPPKPVKAPNVTGPTDARGRFLAPDDAIQYGRESFALYLNGKEATPERAMEWLKSLGAGKASPVDAKALIGKARGGNAKRGVELLNEALTRLPNMAPDVLDHLRANPSNLNATSRDGRAYYMRSDKEMVLYKYDGASIYMHEFTHHIEYEFGLGGRHAEWVKAKATGPLTPLRTITGHRGYRANEVAYPDHFATAYIGKAYGFGATEVLTMGTQYLVEDPRKFYEEHPEHFFLTMAALLGK